MSGARSWSALAAALLAAAAAGAPAQEGKPKAPTDDCNPRAPSTPLKIEFTPYWCSTCIKLGLMKDDGRKVELIHRPIETLVKEIELGDEWTVIVTPHFKLLSTLKGAMSKYDDGTYCKFDLGRLKTIFPKIGFGPEGVKLDAHERAHLYQIRIEREYAHFAALTNNTQPYLGMPSPYEVYEFADYSQHHAFCDRYTGTKQDKGARQWHIQEPPNLLCVSMAEAIVEQQVGRGDVALANHTFHNVAHLLIDGSGNYFRETPAWLEEGLGHYYERRENIRMNNFCWAEGTMPKDFTKPDWESTIFTIVRRDKDPPFAQWCEKLQPGELTGVENGLSWGVVKWLVETEPVRFTKMIEHLDDLKLNLTSAQMIDEGFGVSPTVLYQRWRDYVLENWAGK